LLSGRYLIQQRPFSAACTRAAGDRGIAPRNPRVCARLRDLSGRFRRL